MTNQRAARIGIVVSIFIGGCFAGGLKIEAPVNAKADSTITINPNGGDCCTAVPFATPTATATIAPIVILTLTPDYALRNNFGDYTGYDGIEFYFGLNARAEGGNISLSLTTTLSGQVAAEYNPFSYFYEIRQVGPDDTTTRPGLTNNAVKNSIVTVKDGTTASIQYWPVGKFPSGSNLIYGGKSVGFKIEKPSDIEVLTKNVEIRAEFPIKYSDDKEYKFAK